MRYLTRSQPPTEDRLPIPSRFRGNSRPSLKFALKTFAFPRVQHRLLNTAYRLPGTAYCILENLTFRRSKS
jgi:hypothetical protein